MKNLISLLFLLLVIFAVVGWFQDWYSFGNVKNTGGKTSLQFEVDRTKIGADISKGEDKLKKTIDGLKDKDASGANAAPKATDPWKWN